MPWTVERVKEELPDVTVKLDGRIHPASVSGRKNAFATVTIETDEKRAGVPICLQPFEFSWETITNCLNGNRPLTV
jgi:hypothetical protein